MIQQMGRGALGRVLIAAVAAVSMAACATEAEERALERGVVADREEMRARHLDRMFAEGDADGDGKLTRDEIAAAMERHRGMGPHHGMGGHHGPGDGPGPGCLDDADGDGQISDAEREAMHAQRREEMFGQADTDGDGKLSASELEAAPGPGRMLAEHLGEIDTDADGAIDRDELAAH